MLGGARHDKLDNMKSNAKRTDLIPLGLLLSAGADRAGPAYLAISSVAFFVAEITTTKDGPGDARARAGARASSSAGCWAVVEGGNAATIGPTTGRTSHGVA